MPEYRIVADLSDWQWALAAALLTAALVLGGWWQRQREPEPELQHHSDLQDREAIAELQDQLKQREAELQEARATMAQQQQLEQQLEQFKQRDGARESALNEAEQQRAQMQQQLKQREAELQEAREEAELILLQLHQVQEELEHYFLESRDLQQKLDERNSQPGLDPQHLEQLQRIKARLVSLFAASAPAPADPRLLTLLQRQQNALRRFQRLQQVQR